MLDLLDRADQPIRGTETSRGSVGSLIALGADTSIGSLFGDSVGEQAPASGNLTLPSAPGSVYSPNIGGGQACRRPPPAYVVD